MLSVFPVSPKPRQRIVSKFYCNPVTNMQQEFYAKHTLALSWSSLFPVIVISQQKHSMDCSSELQRSRRQRHSCMIPSDSILSWKSSPMKRILARDRLRALASQRSSSAFLATFSSACTSQKYLHRILLAFPLQEYTKFLISSPFRLQGWLPTSHLAPRCLSGASHTPAGIW